MYYLFQPAIVSNTNAEVYITLSSAYGDHSMGKHSTEYLHMNSSIALERSEVDGGSGGSSTAFSGTRVCGTFSRHVIIAAFGLAWWQTPFTVNANAEN